MFRGFVFSFVQQKSTVNSMDSAGEPEDWFDSVTGQVDIHFNKKHLFEYLWN